MQPGSASRPHARASRRRSTTWRRGRRTRTARRGARRRPRSGRRRGPSADYPCRPLRSPARAPESGGKRLHGGRSMIQGISGAIEALSRDQLRMEAPAKDTANVNTSGFNARDHAAARGALVDTGQPLDLAIEGDGEFQVGNRTTRAGAFQLDASAQIPTAEGEPLVPPVQLPPGA